MSDASNYQDLTPREVEMKLMEMVARGEELVYDFAVAIAQAEDADADYRVAKAKALLLSNEKTVVEREAEATMKTETELAIRNGARGVAEAAKQALRMNESNKTAIQTIAAQQRAEFAHASRLTGGQRV